MTNTTLYNTLVQKDEIFYVYVYLDPRKPGNFIYENLRFDYEPFYIGKGKNNRITEGLYDKRKSKYKISKINKIKESNLEVIAYKLYENLTEEISFKVEIDLIKKIGRKIDNGPLCNFHKGGSGGDNFTNHTDKEYLINKWKQTRIYNIENGITIVSEETKQKLRNSHIRRKEKGLYFNHSIESRNKMSLSHKGMSKPKPKTEEYIEKMRILNLGKIRTEESKEKQSKTCKETLSKIKEKLSLKSSGNKNSNAKRFTIQIIDTGEFIDIEGYQNVLVYYNEKFNTSIKDPSYFIRKLKNGKINYIKLINVININYQKIK